MECQWDINGDFMGYIYIYIFFLPTIGWKLDGVASFLEHGDDVWVPMDGHFYIGFWRADQRCEFDHYWSPTVFSGNLLHSYGKWPIYRWFTYLK